MAQWFSIFWTAPLNCRWQNTYLVKFLALAEQLCIRTSLIKLCDVNDENVIIFYMNYIFPAQIFVGSYPILKWHFVRGKHLSRKSVSWHSNHFSFPSTSFFSFQASSLLTKRKVCTWWYTAGIFFMISFYFMKSWKKSF